MENAKTIRDLLNAAPLSEGDYLPVNQPNVFNPVTQQNGDTRKAKVKQLTDYTVERAIAEMTLIPSPILIALNRQQLQIRAGTVMKITVNGTDRFFKADENVTLDISAILDTGAIQNGKDYYLFLVPDNNTVKFVISLNKSAPTGYSAISVKLVGGLHTLCANAGTGMTYSMGDITLQHPLNGYLAGDILPQSVWCLNHRPHSEPEGMVYIPTMDVWVDIYLQSGSGFNTKSVYHGAITLNRQYVDFVEDQICVNKALLNDEEFAAAMMGSNEKTSVAGGDYASAITNGAGGRSDTKGRRMISIYGVEEGCGSIGQYLATTAASGYYGRIWGQTSANGATPVTYGSLPDATAGELRWNPQSGNKGDQYGNTSVLAAGGYWGNHTNSGSRSRNSEFSRSNAQGRSGGRGRSRPKRFIV